MSLVNFYGFDIPAEKAKYLDRIDEYTLIIRKGYLPGMKCDGIIYCNDELLELLLTECFGNTQNTGFTSCLTQCANVCTLHNILQSYAMPDIHSGYGFSIGGVGVVRRQNGAIFPGGIGFDINCGVRLVRTNLQYSQKIAKKFNKLADRLFREVPSGVGTKSDLRLKQTEFDELMKKGLGFLVERGFAREEDVLYCEEGGCIANNDPAQISKNAKTRGINQIGTLGSGNHYLEVQMVEEIYDAEKANAMGIHNVGQICVMVHCGSRGLGHQVCQDFVKVTLEKGVKSPLDKQLAGLMFDSPEGQSYFQAMNSAANFAFANRGYITYKIRRVFEEVFSQDEFELDMGLVYDVCHNIAKVEKHMVDGVETECIIHRKGATRAFPPGHPELPEKYKEIGQPVIIGGSMGTYSYVLTGTEEGMQKSYGSTCHGAGRKMSRSKATGTKKSADVLKDLDKKGIILRITDPKLASEECDEAYKDVATVVDTCQNAGISSKVIRLKPLIVVKG